MQTYPKIPIFNKTDLKKILYICSFYSPYNIYILGKKVVHVYQRLHYKCNEHEVGLSSTFNVNIA